ncbi:hypothetical protein CYK25_006645 [Varibaculum cambriense]|nr:hypothetical protein CYK25_006645 [Varibaculum cambriense]
MKKTWIVPLTGLLVASLSLSGCGVRIDDGSGDAVTASLTQMARYRASSCQEAITTGIENIFAGDPKLAAFKNHFTARSKVLGQRWPHQKVKLSGKEKPENLPEPADYRVPGNGQALVHKLTDCQADILNDAAVLTYLTREQLAENEGDEEGTARAEETAALAKVLFATGVAMERENKQIASASSLALPPAKTTPLTVQRYQDGKWHPDKAATTEAQPSKSADPLSEQQKTELSRGIRQLDSLRFNIEKNVAKSQDMQLKNLVSKAVTPLLLRQIQELVTQLGSDPREAVYQPDSGLSGADKSAIAKALGQACQVQMNLLPVVPDVQQALLSPTLAGLVDLQAQLGQDAGPLPGLNAKDAKVKISAAPATQ